MSEKQRSKYQGKVRKLKDGKETNATYYIVNPSGAVHMCELEYLKWRLNDRRYRLATDAEIERFMESRVQTHENPIAPPAVIEDIFIPEIPEEEESKKYRATAKARELANENGIDLKDIENPSGAEGDILVADIEAVIKAREK